MSAINFQLTLYHIRQTLDSRLLKTAVSQQTPGYCAAVPAAGGGAPAEPGGETERLMLHECKRNLQFIK